MKAISFENVSKLYNLGVVGTGMFTNDVYRWFKTSILKQEDPFFKLGETNDRSTYGISKLVWALKDISFDIEQGDVVGIIGKNGAGKSTLLKLLSQVTGPTTGIIRTNGRIASLLEVGTGFHSELTGRENIYMNGAVLGMTKQEINRKMDEIIDFSGCERYIDTPVKRYSSGMMVRLGFAVAAHLEPEILVVDEVLSVGDAEFQKKAIGKLKSVSQGNGRTVLFVSHNMTSMRRLCTNGILLENGKVAYRGDIASTIHTYLTSNKSSSEFRFDNNTDLPLCLLHGKVGSKDGSKITKKSPVVIEFIVAVNKQVNHLVLGFNLTSSFEHPLARVDFNENDERHTLAPGIYKFIYQIPANTLAEGEYRIVFDVAEHKVRNYAPEDSELTFVVEADVIEENPYYDNIPTKHSIIHQNWFVESTKLD